MYQGTPGTHRTWFTFIRSRTCLDPSMDPRGPLKSTSNFPVSYRLCLLYLHYTLYIIHFSPFDHVGTLLWSFRNSTMVQRALLDLHGPQNVAENGSFEANSRGPTIKKGPPGSFDGPNWSIFFYKPLDNELT